MALWDFQGTKDSIAYLGSVALGEMFGRSVRETLFQYYATVVSPQQASGKAALKVSSEGGQRDGSTLSLKIHCLLHGSQVFKLPHFVWFQNAVFQDT